MEPSVIDCSESINQLTKHLQFGMKLSGAIDFPDEAPCNIQCNFIGLKDNRYIIFEINNKAMERLIVRQVKGLKIVFRGFTGSEMGHVVAFRSRIIEVKRMISWLMFIDFPIQVESKPIRANKRFPVDLKALVNAGNSVYKARLVDLSASGCALYIDDESVDVKQGNEIFIEPELKYIPKPHPICTVVNVRRQPGGVTLGVAMDREIALSDELRLEILRHVVLHQY